MVPGLETDLKTNPRKDLKKDSGKDLEKYQAKCSDAHTSLYQESLAVHKRLGGVLEVASKVRLQTIHDLSVAYTPGVAEPCRKIVKDPELVYLYTLKRNTIAVVTDGSAVLGLGNIGPYAALPVMEGKAIIFKEFAGIDAFPICLDTQETEEVIKAVKYLAPAFGGINLERGVRVVINTPVRNNFGHGVARARVRHHPEEIHLTTT